LDPKLLAVVFGTVFLSELGDKTQLATLLYASESANPKLVVFLAAASALVLTSALGVLAGGLVAAYVSEKLVSRVAGVAFIAVGLWTLARA
jgi:putative Ca2+/H+ antiporter (TMEM165/GDT1 family)